MEQVKSAGAPPAGVVSNFVDPVNYSSNLVTCNIVLLVVSVLVVAARIVSRTVLTDWRLGWDDCNSSLLSRLNNSPIDLFTKMPWF